MAEASLAARAAVAEADLAVAMASGDFTAQVDGMLQLSEVALDAAAPARALGWVEAAAKLLADGRGGVQVRARFERQQARVAAAAPAGARSPRQWRCQRRARDRRQSRGSAGEARRRHWPGIQRTRAAAVSSAARGRDQARISAAIAAAPDPGAGGAADRAGAGVGGRGAARQAAADVRAAWSSLAGAGAAGASRADRGRERAQGGARRRRGARAGAAARWAEAARLDIGRPLAALPGAFDYARDDGPPVPSRVRFVAAALGHRSAGLGSTLVLLFLGLAMASLAAMGSLAWHGGRDFDAAVGLVLAAVAGVAGWLVAWRIRTARADARRQRLGAYRLGVYFDGDVMLWRDDAGWSTFPRDRVEAARIASAYDSETRFTSRWFELSYRDDAGTVRDWRPPQHRIGIDPAALVALVERWRARGPLHD
ncbi:MAG: hypothetical protein H6701_13950 [Myxococcales bacterium]|nr:hypothetical protein [Myxococcales bacterium]